MRVGNRGRHYHPTLLLVVLCMSHYYSCNSFTMFRQLLFLGGQQSRRWYSTNNEIHRSVSRHMASTSSPHSSSNINNEHNNNNNNNDNIRRRRPNMLLNNHIHNKHYYHLTLFDVTTKTNICNAPCDRDKCRHWRERRCCNWADRIRKL
jgi:hypothetical protein